MIGSRFTHAQRSQHLFPLLFFPVSTEGSTRNPGQCAIAI
jgi:hypothetical protein